MYSIQYAHLSPRRTAMYYVHIYIHIELYRPSARRYTSEGVKIRDKCTATLPPLGFNMRRPEAKNML